MTMLMLTNTTINEYLRYKAHVVREVYHDVTAWHRRQLQREDEWPEYKNSSQEIIEVKPGVYSIAPAKLKITYHKALKCVHPDKTAGLTLDRQILAQEIFIKLNEKWTKYTNKHDI